MMYKFCDMMNSADCSLEASSTVDSENKFQETSLHKDER